MGRGGGREGRRDVNEEFPQMPGSRVGYHDSRRPDHCLQGVDTATVAGKKLIKGQRCFSKWCATTSSIRASAHLFFFNGVVHKLCLYVDHTISIILFID